ncbi:hypothetical protein Goarm_011167, partial [Gossypium armourianum]|nr:hypothetical protein [Gossypium armourianum]
VSIQKNIRSTLDIEVAIYTEKGGTDRISFLSSDFCWCMSRDIYALEEYSFDPKIERTLRRRIKKLREMERIGNDQEIWPSVRYHRWEHFWTISKDNVVVSVVQEFYASLWDQESKNTKGHMSDIVYVQEYFRDIDMDNIINFLTEGRREWKYRP